MEKRRLATLRQRDRLIGLIDNGKIDRQTASGLLYAFGGTSHWRRWSAVLPIVAVSDMRGVFYHLYYGPKFRLRQPLPQLAARLRQAIFWAEPGYHRVVRWKEFVSLDSNSFDPLYNRFPAHNAPDWIWDAVMSHFDGLLQSRFMPAFWRNLVQVEDEWMHAAVTTSMSDAFMNRCMHMLMEKDAEADKYEHLQELWLAGNYPFGYDKEGQLLVLVAD